MGDEPDADQRLDPAVPASRFACPVAMSLDRRRHLEVGGVAQVRGAVEASWDWLATDRRNGICRRSRSTACISSTNLIWSPRSDRCPGREASAGPGRKGARECRHGPGLLETLSSAVRPGRCSVCSSSTAPSPRRSADLRQRHADPALSGAQGAQHHRRLPKPLHAGVRKTLRQAWEQERCPQGRAAGPEPGTTAGEGLAGISATILEGMDESCAWSGSACPGSTALSGLYQHHREHERHHPSGHPECEALARCLDGPALDRRRHDGGQEGIPRLKAYKQLPKLKTPCWP